MNPVVPAVEAGVMDHLEGVYSGAVKLAEGDRASVAVLPIGKFNTAKYGELEITPEMAKEIVTNWENRVLKTDIRFDIGHDMEEAAGWITGLSVGTFPHPVSKVELAGIIAEVEWTPVGKRLLSEKQYRYVSSYLASYKDEETGTVYHNVLMAVALCNDPVMRMLPPVELADTLDSQNAILLGEVVDETVQRIEGQPEMAPEELRTAAWASWPAFSAMDELITEAIAGGLSGDALRARIEELAADLPEAITVAITAAVERANESGEAGPEDVVETEQPEQVNPLETSLADDEDEDPVADLLESFDALMARADDMTRGTSGVRAMRTLASETRKKLTALLSKGGTTTMSENTELTPEAIELAELKQRIRGEKIDAALDALSAKGMTEPARVALSAILKADTPDAIVLSENANPVDAPDALLAFAELVEFVPVAESDSRTETTPPAPEVTLSEQEIAQGRAMGLTEADLLKAKLDNTEKEV